MDGSTEEASLHLGTNKVDIDVVVDEGHLRTNEVDINVKSWDQQDAEG